ncbi:MAG: TIM barrel protein [Clostridia bacterium]|nr:TIM barrel protein [Clostridia bacterium]
MVKFGVADYGLLVWDGGFYDYEDRLEMVQSLGFDGLERLYPTSAEDALRKAAQLKKKGMGFGTCNASTVELSIKWTAALGGEYVWAEVQGRQFDIYLRQVQKMGEACKKYGIKVAVHNHLGTPVETQEQVERVMDECPDAYLLLDTGHLAAAGGDVKYIAQKYYDRIVAYHLKNWQTSDTPDAAMWYERGRFCGLAQGDVDAQNEFVLKHALKNGFDGWIYLEHDKHLREPELDLKESFDLIKKWREEL